MAKLKLVDIIKNYRGAPYKLGGSNKVDGYDCFSLVLAFGEHLGVSLPDDFKGHTVETYSGLWLEDPDKAEEMMLELFEQLGKEIPFSKAFASDILIVESDEGMIVGIHAGNGLLISSFTDVGVELVNISSFKVKGAYRWERTYR